MKRMVIDYLRRPMYAFRLKIGCGIRSVPFTFKLVKVKSSGKHIFYPCLPIASFIPAQRNEPFPWRDYF
jgi:hypothetical protein